jgi:hypothetical protein
MRNFLHPLVLLAAISSAVRGADAPLPSSVVPPLTVEKPAATAPESAQPTAPTGAADRPAAAEPAARSNYELFTEANQLFKSAREEADLRRAVEDYRALLSRGIWNGGLLYNLGCAHLRLGEVGPAIVNLRRALIYMPENARAAEALEFARSQVTDEFPRDEEGPLLKAIFFWHYRTSFEARLWVAILAHFLFWTLLASSSAARFPFRRTTLIALLLLTLSAGGSAAAEGFLRPGREGVIVAPQTEVRAVAAGDGPSIFKKPVHSGVEVRILESSGSFRRVEFPGGIRGFVIASAVEPIDAR